MANLPVWLTTRECAEYLGVTSEFVRGEIRDGRLVAGVHIRRPNGRNLYRVDVHDLRTYCQENAPAVIPHLPAA